MLLVELVVTGEEAPQRALRVEPAKYALPESVVLLLDPVLSSPPLEGLTAHDVLVRSKLTPGQVNLGPIRESVPPVVVGAYAIGVNLAPYELSTEEVMNDHDGSDALPPSRVLGRPGRTILRSAGLRVPGLGQRTLELADQPSSRVHRGNLARDLRAYEHGLLGHADSTKIPLLA